MATGRTGRPWQRLLVAAGIIVAVAACSGGDGGAGAQPPAGGPARTQDSHDPLGVSTTEAAPSSAPVQPSAGDPAGDREAAVAKPPWLGTRVLPEGPGGFGVVSPTPRVLRDRRLVTTDLLPPPAARGFASDIAEVPPDVAARSTWSGACPVALSDLRYATVTFWGFDKRRHTGELLVHRGVADDIVKVFARLYRARFPIEEMRVVAPPELDAPPTGDGNNTTAFVCRPSRGSTSWSQHAYGRAVDINPFHNPYIKGDLVLPELASAYTRRDRRRPGLVLPDGPVVAAFDDIGWVWGGTWSGLTDWMHFSLNGR